MAFVIWHLWHSSSGIYGIRHLAFMAFVIWHLALFGIHGAPSI
jgi:hypothetical protein